MESGLYHAKALAQQNLTCLFSSTSAKGMATLTCQSHVSDASVTAGVYGSSLRFGLICIDGGPGGTRSGPRADALKLILTPSDGSLLVYCASQRNWNLQILDVFGSDLEVEQHLSELVFYFVVGAHDCTVNRFCIHLIVSLLFLRA